MKNLTTADVVTFCAFLLSIGYCVGFWVRAWIARTREEDYVNALHAQARYHDEEKRKLIKCLCPPPSPDLTAHTRGETN